MNICIITGASSGMGREIATQIDRIYTSGISEIWLIARRTDKLTSLAASLHKKTRIMPLDLTSDKDLAELELSLELINPNIKLLINASGYGIIGDFENIDTEEATGQVRLNCEALTHVTHLCLPHMEKGARIINFASSAAFVPQPGFSVYAASKSYVLSFSRALNEELRSRGISVTAVCPGPVDTEFFTVAEKYGKSLSLKKHFMASKEEVVHKALYDAYKRKPVSVYSFWMNMFGLVTKVFPHDLILFVMGLLK